MEVSQKLVFGFQCFLAVTKYETSRKKESKALGFGEVQVLNEEGKIMFVCLIWTNVNGIKLAVLSSAE